MKFSTLTVLSLVASLSTSWSLATEKEGDNHDQLRKGAHAASPHQNESNCHDVHDPNSCLKLIDSESNESWCVIV